MSSNDLTTQSGYTRVGNTPYPAMSYLSALSKEGQRTIGSRLKAVAEKFRQNALKAQSEGRHFSVALCGGETPYGVYAQLAKPDFQSVPWDVVHLFWGDERCVPPEHSESNYKMVCCSYVCCNIWFL